MFAERLNEAGYIVVADDHRGFGKSAIDESYLGHLDGETGFQDMIKDEVVVPTYLKETYPGRAILFSHTVWKFRHPDFYGATSS